MTTKQAFKPHPLFARAILKSSNDVVKILSFNATNQTYEASFPNKPKADIIKDVRHDNLEVINVSKAAAKK